MRLDLGKRRALLSGAATLAFTTPAYAQVAGGGGSWAGMLNLFLQMFSGTNGVLLSTVIIVIACLWGAATEHMRWPLVAIFFCGAAMVASNIAQTIGGG
jgi:type IV secretory pathway VirB2 component (pilin)